MATCEAYNQLTDANEACEVTHVETRPERWIKVYEVRPAVTKRARVHVRDGMGECQSKACREAVGSSRHSCIHVKAVMEATDAIG